MVFQVQTQLDVLHVESIIRKQINLLNYQSKFKISNSIGTRVKLTNLNLFGQDPTHLCICTLVTDQFKFRI